MTRCGDSAQDSGSLQLLGPLPRNYTASPRHDAHNRLWQSSLLTKRERAASLTSSSNSEECLISSLPPSPRPNHSVTRDNWDTPIPAPNTGTKAYVSNQISQVLDLDVDHQQPGPGNCLVSENVRAQHHHYLPSYTRYHQSLLPTPTHDTKGGSLDVVGPLVFLTQQLLVYCRLLWLYLLCPTWTRTRAVRARVISLSAMVVMRGVPVHN